MRKSKRKVEVRKLTEEVDTLLADYKCCNFCFRIRTFVLGLPRKYLLLLLNILENRLTSHDIPARIPLMIKDTIAYRKRAPNRPPDEVDKKRKQVHGVMVVHFQALRWLISLKCLMLGMLYQASCRSLILP